MKNEKSAVFQIMILLIGFLSFVMLINFGMAEELNFEGKVDFSDKSSNNNWFNLFVAGAAGLVLGAATCLIPLIAPFCLVPIILGAVGGGLLGTAFRETVTQTITYSCEPWEPSVGGENCHRCNEVEVPCNEYRCSSLGQSCVFVDDEGENVCVESNSRDISPPIISPNKEVLSVGYEYIDLDDYSFGGAGGYKIRQNNANKDEYVKAGDPITFGITTDEPAKCKISLNRSTGYDGAVKMGGDSSTRSSFSETMNLPNADILKGAGLTLVDGKEMNLYVWCQDHRGNQDGPYLIRFNVDPTPDITSPTVIGTVSGGNDKCVGTSDLQVGFKVKDSSLVTDCRWSRTSQSYNKMEANKTMSCISSNDPTYRAVCTADLNGVARELTSYYVACKDGANNSNIQPAYELKLRVGSELKLDSVKPISGETIYGTIQELPVILEVQTLLGCNDGKADCKFAKGPSARLIDLREFDDTNNIDGVSTHTLFLNGGSHEYLIQCVDEGGNTVQETINFDVEIDSDSPIIARMYEEEGDLKIITAYDSNCSYSLTTCTFDFDTEGTVMPYSNSQNHILPWDKEATYYIKCTDGLRTIPQDCSTIVRPTSNY